MPLEMLEKTKIAIIIAVAVVRLLALQRMHKKQKNKRMLYYIYHGIPRPSINNNNNKNICLHSIIKILLSYSFSLTCFRFRFRYRFCFLPLPAQLKVALQRRPNSPYLPALPHRRTSTQPTSLPHNWNTRHPPILNPPPPPSYSRNIVWYTHPLLCPLLFEPLVSSKPIGYHDGSSHRPQHQHQQRGVEVGVEHIVRLRRRHASPEEVQAHRQHERRRLQAGGLGENSVYTLDHLFYNIHRRWG